MNKHNLYAPAQSDARHVRRPQRQGFTVIELLVVIMVIGILASISILAYTQVQRQARDDVRNNDITLFQNELEKYFDKNGEYPPGCPRSSCTSWFLTGNTSSSQMLNSAATLVNITSVLPGTNSNFGDPLDASTTPLMDTTTSIRKYYYFGGNVNNTSSSSSLSYSATASFPCTISTGTLGPDEVSSYVAGFFSESSNSWVLRGGRAGKPMTVTAGTPAQGCVINPT